LRAISLDDFDLEITETAPRGLFRTGLSFRLEELMRKVENQGDDRFVLPVTLDINLQAAFSRVCCMRRVYT
jgi:hypothetical protein